MNWKNWVWGSRSKGAGNWTLPRLVVELEPAFVLAAQIDGGTRQVRRMGACELEGKAAQSDSGSTGLPAGALPAQAGPAAGPGLHRALQQVMESIGNGAGRIGLLVPDPAVRVSLLEFESLPEDRREAEALVRWRLKDSLPFPADEARVAYQVMGHADGGREILAMVARNSTLSEYEKAVQDRTEAPAVTLPATAALLPLLPESIESALLLVHVCASWATTVLIGGGRVRLWRTRDLTPVKEEEVADEIAREAARAVASSRDHHQLEVGRVWVCARRTAGADPLAALARAVPVPVEPLLPAAGLAIGLASAERTLFERFGATVAGLVMNFGGETQ